MAAFAVRPDCLATNRVPSNNLPPFRFQPYTPLAPHQTPSLWFRKTTRLTDVQRRFFAGRTQTSSAIPCFAGEQPQSDDLTLLVARSAG